MLKARNLKKSYGDKKIICGIDLDVNPSEIVAVIGPSGTGKSTFLRSLSLIEPPDEGEIAIDNQKYRFPLSKSIKEYPWPELTLVFQQFFLWPHLTIRQNLELPLRNKPKIVIRERIEEQLGIYKVLELADRYPNEISVGQRQRVALARAASLQPKYLLLDEVTSALDGEHIRSVMTQLKALAEKGTAIVLVTHLIGFAQEAADQVVFMEDGQIVEQGNAEILTEPKTPRLKSFLSLVKEAPDSTKAEPLELPVYVLNALLQRLRSGELPDQKTLEMLTTAASINFFNENLKPKDQRWLHTLSNSKTSEQREFAQKIIQS